MKTAFERREFESDEHWLFTFLGHGGWFCIMFNGKCIHSVKTKSSHDKKLKEMVDKHNLIELEL
jgi:hypothetical protein